jgi:plastocyanin
MTRWLAIGIACTALALGAIGCGDDDDGDGGGGGGDSAQTDTGASTEGTAKVAVGLKDIAFNPANITLSKGTTVQWTNDDSAGHDVTKTEGPGPDFKSGAAGAMAKGDTFEHTFDTVGEIDYVCTVHSNMKGKIIVR